MSVPSPIRQTSWVEVDGRRIKIADDDRTQSVNLCSAANIEGDYDQVFYFCGHSRINAGDIGQFTDLPSLVSHLRERLYRQVYDFSA